uniref:Uncharacterized protein n=1 Tax=Cacopsylla melanoneura TaxID=428564 RepID=A0A8D9AE96_9HEMI
MLLLEISSAVRLGRLLNKSRVVLASGLRIMLLGEYANPKPSTLVAFRILNNVSNGSSGTGHPSNRTLSKAPRFNFGIKSNRGVLVVEICSKSKFKQCILSMEIEIDNSMNGNENSSFTSASG